MVSGPARALLLVVAATTSACGDQPDHVDVGIACLIGMEVDEERPVVGYFPGSSIPILIQGGPCLSGSCDDQLSSSCEVTDEGDAWVISTEAKVRQKPKLSCTDDCNFLQFPPCALDRLNEGTHRIVYGDSAVELTLPYEGPPICLGE